MAATFLHSFTHASCSSHGAHDLLTPAPGLTPSSRASFSPRSPQHKLQRSYFTSNTAITLFRLPQQKIRTEEKRFQGVRASHAAPPPPSSSSPGTLNNSNVLTSLAIAIAIPLVSGSLASIFNAANVKWYDSLRKPSWNPPKWLFGAAWTVLYGVMGFASWLVWAQGGWKLQSEPLTVYAIQLILNLAWPALFFGAKRMVLALIDIVALWVAVVACISAFRGVNLLAARLFYPYLAWVTFATALNYSYWKLNAA